MKIKVFKKYISLILAGALLFQPFFGVVVLAAAENTQTGTDSSNQATADAEQTASVQNENTAVVENNVQVNANSGDNEIKSPEPTPTSTQEVESISSTSTEPTPTLTTEPEITPTPSENLAPSPTPTPEISEQISPSPTPQLALNQGSTESGVVAENQETGENSENTASASAEQSTTIVNNNQTEVENTATVSAETGSNETEGNLANIQTSEATAEANLVNVVNTNLVGSDFWQVMVNLFSTTKNDMDLTQLEGYQNFDPILISVLAKNENTGDGSINLALANVLSAYSVYNTNTASLTNNVDVSATTGNNAIEGDEGVVNTGSASASLNLFNLVNTNLVGSDWFFGIFNFFSLFGGNLILPYELDYLFPDENQSESLVLASNQNTGENSQNQATATSSDSTTVNNNNEATVTNNLSVSANTGNNKIIGDEGTINSGNAQALANLINIINTNITGSRWLLLAINNYGGWQGQLLGWWGNTFTIGSTTYAWVRLPNLPGPAGTEVSAVNQDTGDGSQNQANAAQTASFEVINNNTAAVENNVTVTADSGNNQATGENTDINTGDAQASANIINVINTNIIGNNWFFGIVNIFGNFLGDIIFPRPDLKIEKTADKTTVAPGEEITYTIFYKDSGRLWAKNVIVEDSLPPGVAFVSASNGVFENSKVVWKFDKINSGDEGNFTVVAKVNSDVSDNTNITNCVGISTGTDEPNKGNNQSCVSTLVSKTPPGRTATPTPTQQPQPTPTPTPETSGGGGETGGGTGGPSGGIGGPSEGFISTSGGGGGSSTCTPPESPKAPSLVSATNISSTEVKLVWTKVDRATHYLISYGDFPGHYVYGNPDVGNSDSYIIGSLDAGKTYYFVVAAIIGGDCPVAGPYSNELANSWGLGEVFGISQVFDEGEGFKYGEELGGGISTQAGEVAGAQAKGACPFWWIVLLGQIVLLGGFYGLLLRRKEPPKRWWLVAPALVILAYLIDRYAHTYWYIPSRMCPWEKWLGIGLASLETIGYRKLRKKTS